MKVNRMLSRRQLPCFTLLHCQVIGARALGGIFQLFLGLCTSQISLISTCNHSRTRGEKIENLRTQNKQFAFCANTKCEQMPLYVHTRTHKVDGQRRLTTKRM